MIYHVAVEWSFLVEGTRDLVDAAVMEAMLEQEAACGVADSAVSVDLGKSHVTLEFVAHGDDYDQAVAKAMPAIRSPIHAVGGRTRTWPSHDEVMRHSPLEMIAQPA
jgi:hypothetical protein